jgi:small subunit ribosomal protein S16
MAVKIRLQRHGRGKRPFYHIVATDSRNRRDGKYIERLGDYNPLTSPATIHLDVDKTVDWLMKGAEPTDTVHAILKYKGVTYRKHLLRGVAKGVLTQEAADIAYQTWKDEHANSILDHARKAHKSKEDRLTEMLAEETKKKESRDTMRRQALEAAQKAAIPVIEPIAAPVIETIAEVPAVEAVVEAPAVEAVVEAPTVVETPAVEVAPEAPAAEATEAPAAE